ncbi:MAG: response regulator, partial [Myxococcota bacterium]
ETVAYVPVVVVSSTVNPEEIRRAYINGATAFVRKPYDLGSLERFASGISEFWFEAARLPA